MKKIIHHILEPLWKKRPKKYKVKYVEEVSDVLDDGFIYIIGHSSCRWLLSFQCPCGCERTIYLNLLDESTPGWQYVVKKNLINISPSVRRIQGCRSHFIVRKSKIVWIAGKGTRPV